jgi:ATP phosphoribosyltransferase
MSAPFVIAVPAKGRLQENAESFFARAGLELVKPRGARDYRGAIADLPGIEVAYLSAAEIVALLAQGAVHLASPADLVRERSPPIAGAAASALGSAANCTAVRFPGSTCSAWPISTTSRAAFHLKHERKMRVATKYREPHPQFILRAPGHRLDRGNSADRRPRSGVLPIIVDIRPPAALAANGLRWSGRRDPALAGHLVAARSADWAARRATVPPSCSTTSRPERRAGVSQATRLPADLRCGPSRNALV